MNNRTWNWWDFPATGYITTKLSYDELSPIRQEVYEIRDRLPACVQTVRNWVAS